MPRQPRRTGVKWRVPAHGGGVSSWQCCDPGRVDRRVEEAAEGARARASRAATIPAARPGDPVRNRGRSGTSQVQARKRPGPVRRKARTLQVALGTF